MGPLRVPGFSEDCLTLNVWSAADGGAAAPVLVFFHGGGFMYGAGSAQAYDGEVMARRGRLVVVTVNYRLGALGYLYFPPGVLGEDAVANLGLQDQLTALQWVRDNIAAFGGDPHNVTVAGQSAGALSIVSLAAVPAARGLFQRAILESGSLNVPALPASTAEQVTNIFLSYLGTDREQASEALRRADVDTLLHAQDQTLIHLTSLCPHDPRLRPASVMAFQPVIDGSVLREDPASAARLGSMDDLDLLILCTSQEMRLAYANDPVFWTRDTHSIRSEVEQVYGPEGLAALDRYASDRPGKSPPEILCDMLSEEGAVDAIDLADRLASIDRPAFFAWFTWSSPGCNGLIGAAHGAELPFVFNNFEHWSQAPVLSGVDPAAFGALAQKVQDAWISFVKHGRPGEDWPPYRPADRRAMEIGDSLQVITNPAPNRCARSLIFSGPHVLDRFEDQHVQGAASAGWRY